MHGDDGFTAEQEKEEKARIVILKSSPPDGGYGWIIVCASFFANTIVDGVIFTIGESLVSKWQDDYHSNAMQASIAQSLMSAFYLVSGPIASFLTDNYGCRLVTIGGAILTFVGFISASYAPSLPLLYLTYGIIAGTGFGLIFLPSIIAVNLYFEKRRALAVGIAVCGSGIGTTIFSKVFPFLLGLCEQNWRKFVFSISVIPLFTILSGLCYRPVRNVSAEKIVEDGRDSATNRLIDENVLHSESVERETPTADSQQGHVSETEGIKIFGNIQVTDQKERSFFKKTTDVLRKMFDLSLLKDMSFLCLAVSGFFTLCCIFVPFIYLGEEASKLNISSVQREYLLTSLGVANIIGRIICGLIADLPKVDVLMFNNLAIIFGGLVTCCVPLLSQYWMYIIYTIVFAFSVACFGTLRSVICVEIVGLEKLPNGFGILLLFMGVAAFIGPPIAAHLKDWTGDFSASFYLVGLLYALSGLMCVPLRTINKYQKARLEHKNRAINTEED